MTFRIGIILIGLLFMSCDNNESLSRIDEEATNCSTGTSTANILVNIDEEIYNDDESVWRLASIRGHQMEQAEY